MKKIESLPNKKENSMHFIRHSQAGYKTIKEILKSDNPQSPIDYEKQIIPDLPREGIKLAKEKAEEFFGKLNPEQDILFFVSSNEARALETANIYRQIARTKGFEIIQPQHSRSKLADNIGEGEIRVLNNISLNIKNPLLSAVFRPQNLLHEINLKVLDEETKKKWDKAREIINNNDGGSWGANFFQHSEAIQKIFPDIKSAEDQYNINFQNIIKLIKFGFQKSKESNVDKNIKILGFGHENYFAFALNKYFKDHNISNCEVIDFLEEDERISAEFKGEKKIIS